MKKLGVCCRSANDKMMREREDRSGGGRMVRMDQEEEM